MKPSIFNKTTASFGVALAILLAIGFVSLTSIERLLQAADQNKRAALIRQDFLMLLALTQDIQNAFRGYVITGQEDFLEGYEERVQTLLQKIHELRVEAGAHPFYQQRIDSLALVVQKTVSRGEEIIRTHRQQGFAAAQRIVRDRQGIQLLNSIKGLVTETEAANLAWLQNEERIVKARVAEVEMIILSGSFSALLFLGIFGFLLHRENREHRQAEAALHQAHDDLTQRNENLLEANQRLEAEILARKKLEQQLAFQASIINQAGDAVIVHDRNLQITYWNPMAERMFGWKVEEALGQKAPELLRSSTTPAEHASALQYLDQGLPLVGEIIVHHKDGQPVQVEAHTIAFKNDQSRVVGYINVNRNLTERKKAEETIKRNAARLQTFDRISKTLNEAGIDNDAIMNLVVQRVAELIGDTCAINLLTEDGQWWQTVAIHHPDPEICQFARELVASAPLRSDQGLNASVLQTGEAVMRNDIPPAQWGTVAERNQPYVERYGMSSILIMPINRQDRIIGTLGVIRHQPGHPYTEEDRIILQEIADRLTLALENARLFEALQKERASLARRVEKRTLELSRANLELQAEMAERKRAEVALRESEERFRTLANGSPALMWVNGLEGCEFVNHAYLEYLNVPSEVDLRGYDWAQYLHPEDRERYVGAYLDCFARRSPFEAQCRFRRYDGEYRWMKSSGLPHFTGAGEFLGYVGSTIDITDIIQAEESLRAVQSHLQIVADAMPVVVTRCNRDLTYLWVNKACEELLNRPAGEIGGTPMVEILGQESLNRLLPYYQRVLSGEKISIEEQVDYRGSGRRWVNATYSPTFDAAGVPDGWVGVVVDITERKRMEDEIRCFNTELEGLVAKRTSELESASSELESTNKELESTIRALESTNGELEAAKQKLEHEIAERKKAEAQILFQASLIAEMNDAVIGINPDSVITYWNPGAENIFGWTAEEALGRSVPELLHSKFHGLDREVVLQQARAHGHFHGELGQRHKDGRMLNIDASIIPLTDANGALTGYFEVNRDLTSRKQAEEEIHRYTARLKILDEFSEALVAAKPDTSIVMNVIVQSVAELIGEACSINLLSEDRQWWKQVAVYHPDPEVLQFAVELANSSPLRAEQGLSGQVLQTGAAVILNNLPAERLRATVNEKYWPFLDRYALFCNLVTPLRVHDRIVGTLVAARYRPGNPYTEEDRIVLQELAERAALVLQNAQLFDEVQQERVLLAQRVEERTTELRAANAVLTKALRTKDEFLASMSHELRTPLNTVLGVCEALAERIYGALNERQLKALRSVEESGRHLLALINDILDLFKMDAGRLEFQKTLVAVEPVCSASLRLIAQMAQKKNLSISTAFDGAVERITADERRLKQILVNLLNNAVKFTPAGGAIGLEALSSAERNWIHFTVWDNGIGIAAEDLSKLFQPFVQLDSSLSRQYAGTGMGLVLVQRMVEMHGGRVTVTSAPGKGSRFTVSLPVK